MKKISFLGLVLLAASAVTAALLPKKSKDLKQVNSVDNATLRSQSGVGSDFNFLVISCVADNTLNWSCHLSFDATFTGSVSENFANRTEVNTSDSLQGTGHNGDTTSIHI